jgi:hypothetical protein
MIKKTMSITYRVVRVRQEITDIEVPESEVSKGLEAAQAYAFDHGVNVLDDPDAHTYTDKTVVTLRVNAYIKQPYPSEDIDND